MPANDTVPCSGAVTIWILVTTPLMCAVRLIADVVLNSTVTALSAAVGAGGAATVRLTVAGAEVPPGPVAVKAKLSLPTNPALGE